MWAKYLHDMLVNPSYFSSRKGQASNAIAKTAQMGPGWQSYVRAQHLACPRSLKWFSSPPTALLLSPAVRHTQLDSSFTKLCCSHSSASQPEPSPFASCLPATNSAGIHASSMALCFWGSLRLLFSDLHLLQGKVLKKLAGWPILPVSFWSFAVLSFPAPLPVLISERKK